MACLTRVLKLATKRMDYGTREYTQHKRTRIVGPTIIGASAHNLSTPTGNAKQVCDTTASLSTAGADLDCTISHEMKRRQDNGTSVR